MRSIMAANSGTVRPGTALPALASPCSSGSPVSEERSIQRCISSARAGSFGTSGGDPAAVAFDAIEAATARGIDVVLIDTAGRLHTHDDLMEELKKIFRVVSRRRDGAPHESLLVLDGTVGQNALQQGRRFAEAVPLTGLVITKLDGTAKGGAVLTLRRELDIPIRFLGTGEQLKDLEDFDSDTFVERLLSD